MNHSINGAEVINTSCSDSSAEIDYRYYWVDSSCVHTAASGMCMYRVHKPVLGSRYSGTVSFPCCKAYLRVQLHIDDAILFIVDYVMGYKFSLHKNSKG